MSETKKVRLCFLPQEKVTSVPEGTTLFDAANWLGLAIDSTCGGRGTCGKCKVQVLNGSAPTAARVDQDHLTPDEIADGWRVSCRTPAVTDMEIEVPPVLGIPKAALMGFGKQVILAPNVHKIHLQLSEPDLKDQRSDLQRTLDGIRDEEGIEAWAGLDVWRTLPQTLRQADWDVTAVVVGDELIAVEQDDTRERLYGLAVDVGTTTVVTMLMDLRSGMPLAVESTLNSQASFGADVISRISHVMMEEDGLAVLQQRIVETLNELIEQVTTAAEVPRHEIHEIVVAGNATMQHLLLGLNPEAISMVPFIPVVDTWTTIKARQVGLVVHPEAQLHIYPCIGAYVGGDIVAGLIATELTQTEKIRLFIDVGTNGEIALGSSERSVATAAPAGPAFEGAQIRSGMRAAPGAIEGVTMTRDTIELQVIGDTDPVGICGSGLIDLVAEMVKLGVVKPSGRLLKPEQARERLGDFLADRIVTLDDGVITFVVVTEEESGGRPVSLTQRDIRELQFAKAAIATGAEILCRQLGIAPDEIDEVLLAGSFGSYINPTSARRIGLVPDIPVERIKAVGNAAGEGAKIALMSFRDRAAAQVLPEQIGYYELSGRTDFNDAFVDQLSFPQIGVEE